MWALEVKEEERRHGLGYRWRVPLVRAHVPDEYYGSIRSGQIRSRTWVVGKGEEAVCSSGQAGAGRLVVRQPASNPFLTWLRAPCINFA